jgi:hypothetical protein
MKMTIHNRLPRYPGMRFTEEGRAAAAQREKLGFIQPVTPARGKFSAVQKAAQPVAGEFCDHHRVH